MGTKSFQRERRFLCGTSKNAANYQEVEIYPMNGTEQSRTLDQELARAADLRRSSKAQQNQNAKNARRLFRQKPAQRKAKVIPFDARSSETSKAAPKASYTHRCTVCGRTDVSNPELEFRYCSKCKGYYCYCQDHINNHSHIQ